MSTNPNAPVMQEIRDLKNQVKWLDDERRGLSRKLSDIEQKMALREQALEEREKRVQTLERQMVNATAQLSRAANLDKQLAQLKDELVHMMEQQEQRRVRAVDEMERVRHVEHETVSREIAGMRKELPAIGRLQEGMELRISEEGRLAALIGEYKNRISALENQVETREHVFSFLEEKEKANARAVSDVKTTIIENSKRLEHLRDQLDLHGTSVVKYETNQQAMADDQVKMQEKLKQWTEQVQIGEYERNQRLEKWRHELDQHDERIADFTKEWARFSDQYKEARMAVQTLNDWQKQLEQQQREASELLRVETHRLQSLWDDYKLSNESRWTNFNMETEQRWSNVDRNEKKIQAQFRELQELVTQLENEKQMLQRIQTAQSDAIKRWPLMWMEEVEKAIAQNPNRRRQPALVPVREE